MSSSTAKTFGYQCKILLKKACKLPLKRALYLVDPLYIAWYRRKNQERGPIPPMINRSQIGAWRIGEFMASGRRCYEPILVALTRYSALPVEQLRILDFGAGAGRTLQYFQKEYPTLEIFASDINSSAMAYLNRSWPRVRAETNLYEPPLNYNSGYFDAVYSVSIWSHLPPSLQQPWLDEIRRVVKPGGLALITTLGDFAIRAHRGSNAHISSGVEYNEYPFLKLTDALPGVTGSYGVTYLSTEHVRRVWGETWDILDLQEGAIDGIQDLVVLRKRT